MVFRSESEFESEFVAALQRKGWETEVLARPTEQELIDNWAKILFENNRQQDRLGDAPLTSSEMAQILEQIAELRTPLRLNGFINGKTVSITRDNPDDPDHLGKEVSLKIYDRHEIAAGQSRYQIAQQPLFPSHSAILGSGRGDLMLLINGMPVIHIELKKSGIPVHSACEQIKRYATRGVFTGLFSLVQIFVASNPDETVYFANPGPDGAFNRDYFFRWADFNNEPVNDWHRIVSDLLAIPMAHQLIGFYTVADDTDNVLKVMRSYQYYAVNRISDRVAKVAWGEPNQRGGYVWHTTGSGKTMTSFKAAQLIANSKDADKVIFLMDRIELGTQSLMEYRAFAEATEDVQATENTDELISKLKSPDPSNTLVVTSIQKMSRIRDDFGLRPIDLKRIQTKRIVFIVDEAHRSTFGEMLTFIKETFPEAIFFGFTGTPIQDKNQKKKSTTATIFGDELHRYSIADGIRDENVLGFDTYRVDTFRPRDLRKAVALAKSNSATEQEALSDIRKAKIYYHYLDNKKVPQAGYTGEDGLYIRGIEDYLSPRELYDSYEHRQTVVDDIVNNWHTLSRGSTFHALLATSSIPEAIEYFRQIKESAPDLRVTALFDPNSPEGEGRIAKEDGLVEILTAYNKDYGRDFTIASHAKFKKDVAARLAHKKPYARIEPQSQQQLDILIVVDQMLTGFDSKWLNTLYLDKVIAYENIIQAFSRTNRLWGRGKPFGTIRYYRRPATMYRNIQEAVALYSGNRPLALFVEQLDVNLEQMNRLHGEISRLFAAAEVPDFHTLPSDLSERGEFAKLFGEFNDYLEAARVQGFNWEKRTYEFDDGTRRVEVSIDEPTYLTLALRYRELASVSESDDGTPGEEFPYDIDTHLSEIDTGRIDADYINSRFEKYLRALHSTDVSPETERALLDELHSQFAHLSQEEQRHANLFLHDVQTGDAILRPEATLHDYIAEYQEREIDTQINRLVAVLGVSYQKLRTLVDAGIQENNLNEFGRFDDLKATVDIMHAERAFAEIDGATTPRFKLTIRIHKILREFVLHGRLPEELQEP